MEWRGGNHIVPVDFREDGIADRACRRCGEASRTFTFDGLCGACDYDLYVAHPDCPDAFVA